MAKIYKIIVLQGLAELFFQGVCYKNNEEFN